MSEETKNPLIESFLKLHELVGGTYQDTLSPAEKARRAQFATPPAPAAIPPRPAMDTAPQPQTGADNVANAIKNAAANRSASALGGFSKVTPDVQGTSSFSGMPKTNQGAISPEGFIKRMSGVEKANPVASVGKLEGGNLSVGSRGDDVKALQSMLIRSGAKITADGIFGDKTAAALKAMQQSAGLKADAVYGKQTASYVNRKNALSKLRGENPIGAKKMELGTEFDKADRSSGINRARLNSAEKESGDVYPGINSYRGRADSTKSALDNREIAANDREAAADNAREIARKELKFKQGIREEESTMSNKLIDSFLKLQATNSPNLFEAAKKAKKLDPVGKEDEDIDNDGIPIKKDKHDQYLANRRKAIGKAMKEATDPNAEGIAKDKQKAPIMVPKPDYPTSKPGPTRELKGSLPKGVTVKGNTNEAVSPMANQGTSGSQTVKRDLPSAVSNYMASKRETNRVEGEPGSRQRSMIDDIKKTSFDAKTPGENVVAFGKALGGRIAEPFVKTVDAIKGYNKPESKVIKTGNNSSTVMKNEEVEQIDEALSAEHKAAIKAHVKGMWGRGEVAFGSQGGKDFVSHSDGIQKHVHSIHYKKGVPHVTHFLSMDEEVKFSEVELEHIAAILEANPVAPVPDDYSGAAGGVSKRDLSDETVAEEKKTKKKTAGTGRPRGRPAGSKSGSKHGSGGDGGVETKNLAAQIRFSRPSDGHFMLKHPKTGVTKAVPAKAATEFYSKYSGAEKPAEKEAHHDAFLTKHFGGESKPKTGITLPKMPASKS